METTLDTLKDLDFPSDEDVPRNAGRKPYFAVSVASSADSSRASSPTPFSRTYLHNEEEVDIPFRQIDVYDATLIWWRAAIRRKLVKSVRWESEVIARMQDLVRTSWLDSYFVYTSFLGTHTFFMTFLPALFFFGYDEIGCGLLMVVALGVYCTSFVKDLFCSPRPFAPPVTRLTISNHHLEYGFPSTHSTNSVSIALLLFGHLHRLASTPAASTNTSFLHSSNFSTILTSPQSPLDSTTFSQPVVSAQTYTFLTIALVVYTFSIVLSRLYTAMHSFTDCTAGAAIGAAIWWGHSSWSGIPVYLSSSNLLYWLYSALWPSSLSDGGTRILYIGKGLGAGEWIESWIRRGGWEVPLILIPVCLLAVNQHPQPVDDCPCFEDAIASVSVALGSLVGTWAMAYSGADAVGRSVIMPGSGLVYELGEWIQVERTWADVGVWWSVAVLKMVVGILVIFGWRIAAKAALHLILPPIFRFFARAFDLPSRRFYIPATVYKKMPSDFNTPGRGIRPIPSLIDLPGSGSVGVEVGGIGSGSGVGVGPDFRHGEIKLRGGSSNIDEKYQIGHTSDRSNGHARAGEEEEEALERKDEQPVKHYDADVLTKVFVYAGIAVLAREVLPAMFAIVGWGVRSWV